MSTTTAPGPEEYSGQTPSSFVTKRQAINLSFRGVEDCDSLRDEGRHRCYVPPAADVVEVLNGPENSAALDFHGFRPLCGQ